MDAPLYSMPHLSLATTGLPVRSLRKGFGLTGTCIGARTRGQRVQRGDELSWLAWVAPSPLFRLFLFFKTLCSRVGGVI